MIVKSKLVAYLRKTGKDIEALLKYSNINAYYIRTKIVNLHREKELQARIV